MRHLYKLAMAAFGAAFFIASAQAQNAGTVTSHAFAIGKGAGHSGYTSLLCTSAQLAVGQSAADPICRTITGDVTINAAGVTAIGATKVTSAMLNADVFSTAHTWAGQQSFVAPVLGTPASGTLTNATGLPISTGVSGLGSGIAAFLGTPSSANLKSAVTDETGSGALVFATSPTLVTPSLGTPASATLTNATGLPIATGVSGLGSGVATFLATPSSANLRAALTDETGTGAAYFVGGALGTPASGTATNLTGLPLSGLTAQGAYTFVGNNSGSSAVPTAVGIAALTTKASPAPTDYIMLSDQAASGAWKKATVSSVASAGSVSSIAGNTGAFTLSNGITNSANDIRLNIGHLPGEPSNGNAAAGEVGEFMSSNVTAGSAITLTSGTPSNVTFLDLTAGDWDVSGAVVYAAQGSTAYTEIHQQISKNNATLETSPAEGATTAMHVNFITGQAAIFPSGPRRFLINTTTRVYLTCQVTNSGSAMLVYGYLRARRMR